MCGIAGMWAPDIGPKEREALVRSMLGALAHRGPDGIPLWSDERVTLGLARLAIVAPNMPARVHSNETATIHAVANGEVYNYRSLARELVARGHEVPAGTDTSLIPHLVEDHGAEFPLEIEGMFAAVVWDAPRGVLVLARDRAGEKPLFTSHAGGRFAFASEPAALLRLPWVSRDPDPDALTRYLVHGCFAGGDSAFAAIRQVPPATTIEVWQGVERARRYWRPWDCLSQPPPRRSVEQWIRHAGDELQHAVATRIPEHVPFGVLLSGGLDSGLIAAAAAHTTAHFPTFSMRLVGDGYDESAHARRIADHLGTEHHEISMDVAEGREALDTFAAGADQPLGDPSLLPTWALARFAAKHVPVVLTGEGGDELFAGYPTYLGHRYAALAGRIPPGLNRLLLAAARRLRPARRHLSPAYFVERFLSARGMDAFERHVAWFGNFGPREAGTLLGSSLRSRVSEGAALAHVAALAGDLEHDGLAELATGPKLASYQLLDFQLALGGGLLTKIDRCAMAHSIESRAPFLRKDVIELGLTLPDDLKLRGVSGKWILKQVARTLLPEDIITRRKQGFSPPFSAWARGPLRGEVQDILGGRRVERAGVLDPAAVAAVLARHMSGEAECGRAVWSLLSLQLWAERWVSGAATSSEPVCVEASREPAAR